MHSGDLQCAHSPLRISPPCKNSKVKAWMKGEKGGVEQSIAHLAPGQNMDYTNFPGTKRTCSSINNQSNTMCANKLVPEAIFHLYSKFCPKSVAVYL
jgi:hypothetical protein